jgi:hypothetical protein
MPPYTHQSVRDLAWLVGSAPLMAAGTPGLDVPPATWLERLAEQAQPWLAGIDRRPEELDGWLARHRHQRLGHHAEALMEFWLRRQPGVRFHQAHLTINEGGRTLGDLDLLFTAERSGPKRLHWELAVKFYLGTAPDGEWTGWIGPDVRDTLAAKLAKVIDHQLPLGRHPLANHGATQATVSEAFLKGWLFSPLDAAGQVRRIPSPRGAHPDHGRGWWRRHGEGPLPRASRAARFIVLPRLAWLSPARQPRRGGLPAWAPGELEAFLTGHFARRIDAVLVAEVQPDRAGWWAETARGFVVAPAWPDTGGGAA